MESTPISNIFALQKYGFSENMQRFRRKIWILGVIFSMIIPCLKAAEIKVGAERMDSYLPMLEGQRVGLAINHTSRVHSPEGNLIPLPDTLLKRGVDIRCIMAPEHGYTGLADAGAEIKGGTDPLTRLPIYSLYGKNKKPQPEWLEDVDVVVFDMQDVGVRFYTYLSTLYYIMEACAEQGKKLIVMDRPNPNDTIDGPLLEMQHRSFVGIIPIPVVHGCTLGELALMMKGEQWVKAPDSLEIIRCQGWEHGMPYRLPIAPSPNLPNVRSIQLYPSLCLFEASEISVGRGTVHPFQAFGHPHFPQVNCSFVFVPRKGQSNQSPLQEGKRCRGLDLREVAHVKGFDLRYYLMARRWFGPGWITRAQFFDRLAGTSTLRTQLTRNLSEEEIRRSWQEDLEHYRAIRRQYLLYQ